MRHSKSVKTLYPTLRLERLEDRRTPASIAGLAWKDSLGGGTLNGGEIAFVDVPITLYRDGGDGVFNNGGGDDIVAGTTMTGATGSYQFLGLAAERYYVDINQTNAQIAPLVRVIGTDPAVLTLTAAQDATDVNFGYRRQSPPPVTVPAGNDSTGNPFQAPGAFPVRASGALFNIQPIAGSTLGGTGSDNLQVTIPAAGPYRWTESRHNEGDISMSINPAQPANPLSYPPAAFVNNYAPVDGLSTYAWRVNKETGLSFATVHTNGVDNQDVLSGGGAVGTVFGTAYFNTDASSGFGYNEVDGTHRSGGNSQDLQMGLAGPADEGSFNVAVANFPFDEGWVGGYIRNTSGTAGETEFDSGLATPGLSPTVATWTGDLLSGRATVNLTSFRSDFTPANGMRFVAPNSSGNTANIAAVLPSGNGWSVALREDGDADATGNTLAALGDSQFQFMYVDFRYRNLVGARITGSTGATIRGAGTYTLTRLSAGQYALTIPGKVDSSGMLLLGVVGQQGTTGLPSRAFLSYQFDAANSRFVIQAREATATNAATLVDTDFYFTYVDFATPVEPKLPPTVASVVLNGGAAQRSRVTTLAVTFSDQVTFATPTNVAAAFQLSRIGGGAVTFTASAAAVGGVTVVTLTNFTGTETIGGSLVDGRYAITVVASQVSAGGQQFDGNGDGNGGDNYVLNGTATNKLFRYYGDFDGNGTVDGTDLVAYVPTLFNPANYVAQFDFNGDGVVDGTDLVEFVQNLFVPLP